MFSSDCDVRLTDNFGVLESPNFPDPYPFSRDCTWVVETTLGNSLNASFSHFELEFHSSCNYDFVEVILLYLSKFVLIIIPIKSGKKT